MKITTAIVKLEYSPELSRSWDAVYESEELTTTVARGIDPTDCLLQLAYMISQDKKYTMMEKVDCLINRLTGSAHKCGLCHSAARMLTKITWGEKYGGKKCH